MTTQKIHLIGGSGFIGTRLASRLQAIGSDFDVIDKVPSAFFATTVADVRNLEALSATIKDRSSLVVLAAEHRDDVTPRSLYYDVNVTGAKNICQVARLRQIKKIVFTSSVAVYGFTDAGTDESGAINPFNDYGRSKHLAEMEFRAWQSEDTSRSLVIVRPTVVFGESNRGNVYNLLRQASKKHFVMIGPGTNQKSVAYVENVASFLEHCLQLGSGTHTFNYVDKPDFSMNELIGNVRSVLGLPPRIGLRLPYAVGMLIGKSFDGLARLTGIKPMISSVRVKKFCSTSVFGTAAASTGFVAPVPLREALERTVRHEFIEKPSGPLFYSE